MIHKITADEIYNNSVERLANRPNAASRFGTEGLSPEQLKAAYMALPKLAISKINELIDSLNNTDSTSENFISKLILTQITEQGTKKSLYDICADIINGHFIDYVIVNDYSGITSLGELLNWVIDRISATEEDIIGINDEIGTDEESYEGTIYHRIKLAKAAIDAFVGMIGSTTISGETSKTLHKRIDDQSQRITQNANGISSNASAITQLGNRADGHDTDIVNIGNDITNIESDISDINNKLADDITANNPAVSAAFVNSSIGTNTAYFLGEFNSLAELQAYTGQVTNNDYANVIRTDAAGNTLIDRYKYNSNLTQWKKEFTINNTTFTAAQISALNSGITAEAVADMVRKSIDLTNTVIDDNSKIATSKAVYTALQNKQDKVVGKGLSTEDFTTALKTKVEDSTLILTLFYNNDDGEKYITDKDDNRVTFIDIFGYYTYNYSIILHDLYNNIVYTISGMVNGAMVFTGIQQDDIVYIVMQSNGNIITGNAGLINNSNYADDADINSRTSGDTGSFISPGRLDYAVKRAMTDGVGTAWSDTEKNAAFNRLAINKTSIGSVAVAGANYYLGTKTSVSITLPSSSQAGDEITVIWYNGSTPATLSITGNYIGTSYVPVANVRSELNFLYDGTNWCLMFSEFEV